MKTPNELIEKIDLLRSGNTEVFADVYEASYKYLHTCVIHIVKNEDIAQDMLQEAYVEIFKNIGQLKSSEDFLSWAATIANRKCFAYIKKDRDILVDEQKDDEGKETDFFESVADDESFIPENIFDNREKIKMIREIIDDLSDVQRACVIGFYYNEQKQDEIASELGIPVNTVKSHLNRAKAKIKDAVGDIEKKQGVKLYSFSPFMLLLLSYEAKDFAAKAAVPAMGEGITTAVASVGSATASTAGKVVGAKAAKATTIALKTKIAIGAAVAAVGVATVVGVVNNRSDKHENVSDVSEQAEHIAEEGSAESGRSVEEIVAQASEAIAIEDYDAAMELAKEAGGIDSAAENQIRDMVKDAYLGKIDDCTEKEDYEAAYSLINEGNEKLGNNALDDKLSGIPYAVANGAEFTTIDEVEGHLFIEFYENKGDDIYRVTDPKFTYRDKECKVKINNIEMNNTGDGYKEYTITASVDASYTISHPITDENVYWFTDTPGLRFFDYYSGLVINTSDLSMKDLITTKVSGEKDNVISWNGIDYSILISAERKRSDPWAGEATEENGMTNVKRNEHKDLTYTIRCPEDYDGLCIYLYDASQITEDTEKKRFDAVFDASGKYVEDTETENNQIRYMFQYQEIDNEVHSADFYHIMRVTDDIASVEEAEVNDNNAANTNQTVKTDTSKVTEQKAASAQTTTKQYSNTTGLNIDPEFGYDGWADNLPYVDPDYDPTLEWTEEEKAIARSLRFE